MRLHAKMAALLVMALAAAGCATDQPLVQANVTKGEMRGMVYDLDRQPVNNATVTVVTPVAAGAAVPTPISASTDLHGRFDLGVLPYGPLNIKVTKQGAEPLDWSFQFQPGADVLYLQLATIDQLFDRAAAALEIQDWEEFQSNLDRASAIRPDSLQALILQATALEKKGKRDEAIALLESRAGDKPVLVIELMLGDLYSALGNRDKAVEHWTNALQFKEDAAIRAKLGSGN